MKNKIESTFRNQPNPKVIIKDWVFIFLFITALMIIESPTQADTCEAVSPSQCWYVDPNATGANNGTSWANAWISLQVSKGINPGDYVYLSGGTSSQTYTGVSSSTWSSQGIPFQGTANNPVVYKTGQDAGHNGTVIFDGGGTQEFWFGYPSYSSNSNVNYVTVDGNVGNQRHMTIQNYTNEIIFGELGQGLKFTYINFLNGPAGRMTNASYEFSYNYVMTYNSDHALLGGSPALIHHNIFYLSRDGTGGGTGLGDDGIQNITSGSSVYNNQFIGYVIPTNYTTGQHQDGVQTWDSNISIYNNTFENLGNSCIFFAPGSTTTDIYNVYIYNNVCEYSWETMGLPSNNNGGTTAHIHHSFFVNNVVSDGGVFNILSYPGTGSNGGPANVYDADDVVANNVIYNNTLNPFSPIDSNITSSNNVYVNNSGTATGYFLEYSPAVTASELENGTFSAQAAIFNPSQYDFDLPPASLLIAAGTNLSSYCLTLPGLCQDKDGNPRPSTGAWNVGPYQLVSGPQIYIAQSAVGNANGADCTDAYPVTWLNTASNWGTAAGQIGPGTTVHLCGTITTEISVQASGTAGNPIIIFFEPNAKMSAPYWPTAWFGGGAITVDEQNYITIDGGTNGLIEATDNGTTLDNQQNSVGVSGVSASNFTVKNLTIANMYVRTSNTDEMGAFGIGIQDTSTEPPWGFTNFYAVNNIIYNAYIGIEMDYGTVSNVEISHNTIYDVNWGGNLGDRSATSTASGISVHDNHIYNFSNWDDAKNNDDYYHHNGFFGWADSGTLNGLNLYNNMIGPNFGIYSTSGVYFSANVTNINVYNNLFLENANDAPDDGLITLGSTFVNGTDAIYNNTFIGQGNGAAINVGGGTSTYTVENNLADGFSTFIVDNYKGSSVLISDYNFGFNINPELAYTIANNGTSSFMNFATWQANGYDAHGLNGVNPLLNAQGALNQGSPAIAAGTNLTSLGISTLDLDMLANPRPSTGSWDIGAFVYAPSSSSLVYGDVNNDGNVTMVDAQLTAQYAIGASVSNFNTTAAEVDGTNAVNIYDAYLIAERATSLITTFPAKGG